MLEALAGSLGAVLGAVVGALVAHSLATRSSRKAADRVELETIRLEAQNAHEQALLAATSLQALNQRVSDVLDRLNKEWAP